MRSLALSKSGINKIRSHQTELKVTDFEDSINPVPPGDWCLLKISPQEVAIGFVNSLVGEKFTCAHVISKLNLEQIKNFSAEAFVSEKILRAIERRWEISGYEKNARMFYGAADGLPGLLIDQFENASIIQINTAGVDKYRDLIGSIVSERLKTHAYFLDNPKYREKESLPTFASTDVPDLEVQENGLRYKIRSGVLQKVGFYYDHRENRLQLRAFLDRLSKKRNHGLDLFCYAGAWGMNALKAGVQKMTFVDQGDLGVEVETALSINGFTERGDFLRADVFKFIDEEVAKKSTYDLILCDPPAFAKSALQKNQALDGYSKLHRKVLKLTSKSGLACFSSCTHYVSHEEFQKNILDAAAREGRRLQLIYTGMQGFDHPVTSLEDKSNYIKSYFYLVE